ncbi:MAG TPA: 5-bromo-4-chloroindolyl phosphate hydrolysis protein [Leucothrix mucor]|uniref:5-bromo-4-chloroindolyl phosphate hydrolysis protein n=1 Tax=Leucothrix mucor TaxID=45248 RepID=A0A7V2T162_LEUMU|nr:5-bromo-4-chloroindolyl phosphate hydrolysis protein [Leucothrix mucor]
MSSAKRYSPEEKTLSRVKYGWLKGFLLFVMPIPLLIAAIISLMRGEMLHTLVSAAAFAGFMMSAMIAREGFKREGKYQRRRFARAPGTPFKTIAALFLGISTGLTALFATNYGVFHSILLGVAALLGFYFSYGLDPRKDKTGGISLSVSADEVFAALEAAEIKIAGIEAARKNINNLELDQHLKNITQKAREILETIKNDPNDLDRARKFLKVYLDGTQRVTESYAKTHSKEATTEVLDANFRRVLDSIERTFDEQQEKLKENDRFDLDVKIEVLETQLKHEGVL